MSFHTTRIKPFPISIAFYNGFHYQSHDQSSQINISNIRKQLNIKSEYIGLGVDRLDYTKGIIERFKAIEYFLEKYPSYKPIYSDFIFNCLRILLMFISED